MIADLIRAFVEALVVRRMANGYQFPAGWTGQLRTTYGGDLVLEAIPDEPRSMGAPVVLNVQAWGVE